MMLQDIAPYKLDNQYRPDAVPEGKDSVIIFNTEKMPEILINTDSGLRYPMVSELSETQRQSLIYLFSINEERYFLFQLNKDSETLLPEGYDFRPLRSLREKEAPPKYRIYAGYTAKHLFDWYRDTAFCGRCGCKTEHSKTERAKKCPSCGCTAYPRIMPAVIVGVTNGDRLLITKYRTGFAHSALVAGFTEIGETVEETVSREVMEETGVRVKNIRYYKSQPWGVANDILMGYYCDLDGEETIHMDNNELKYAEWVRYDEIVFQPDNFSLTNEMMKHFAEVKKEGQSV
ncbi:MAG: NAD(+) diphosphatase [Eubacteriales bacterium]|nr:NAD(+) diphosphatase [Eubacteriales bacterium]